MNGLEIRNLSISTTDGRPLLSNVSLSLKDGRIYSLTGSNGCGKSTLLNTILGSPLYRVTSGRIILDGQDFTNWSPDQRAKAGLFLAHQYPAEIAGISFGDFLRTSLTNLDSKQSFGDIIHELELNAEKLGFDNFDYHRDLNVGFSGGEKKKSEILQMLALKPRFAFLDEPDSGLDKKSVDKLASVLANLPYPTTLIIVSHHDRLLNQLSIDSTFNLEELDA